MNFILRKTHAAVLPAINPIPSPNFPVLLNDFVGVRWVLAERVTAAVLFVAASCLTIWSYVHRNQKLKVLSKPVLMPSLLLFYVASVKTVNWWITGALFCGFLGDVLLLDRKRFLTAGMGAFLLGHLFYIGAFLNSVSWGHIIPVQIWLLAIPYVLFGLLVIGISRPYLREHFIPAVIYVTVLLSMSFASLCRIGPGMSYGFLLPFAGSLLFVTSDLLLGWGHFIKKSDDWEPLVILTYILAQSAITCGFILGG